jgi:hypothetical protein
VDAVCTRTPGLAGPLAEPSPDRGAGGTSWNRFAGSALVARPADAVRAGAYPSRGCPWCSPFMTCLRPARMVLASRRAWRRWLTAWSVRRRRESSPIRVLEVGISVISAREERQVIPRDQPPRSGYGSSSRPRPARSFCGIFARRRVVA